MGHGVSGPREWDVAYLAYRIVPFAEDAAGFDPHRHGTRGERLRRLIAAYGMPFDEARLYGTTAARLEELAGFTEERAAETGRADFLQHAAMYRRDAVRLRILAMPA